MTVSDSAIATTQSTLLTLDSLDFELPAPDTRQRLLRFPLSTQDSGLLLLEDIAEVFQVAVTDILPVPGVPEATLGICNWRGAMLWLIDFNTLIGYSPLLSYLPGLSPVTVLVIQTQDGTIGLGIPRFDDIELHDLDHLQSVAPGLFPAKMYPFIAGVLPGDQGAVLDGAAIVGCPLWQKSREAFR
ncbi:MAG: chemotaxis protein CheW [Leptolyngbyaceae cyanobacterium]